MMTNNHHHHEASVNPAYAEPDNPALPPSTMALKQSRAALINFRMMANAVWTTEEAVEGIAALAS